MAIINFCGSVGANTGPIACDTKRGNPKVILLGNASFASAGLTSATFKTALLAAVKLATGNIGKLYPFPEITGAANNTEANKEASTGYGVKYILVEGRPAYTWDIDAGVNLEQNLRAFNKQTVPVLVFDDNGNVWGRVDAAGNFVGTKAQIFVSGQPFGDGNNLVTTKVSVNFTSASDFFDFAAFVNTDFNVNDLEGLLDVELTEQSAHAANLFKILATVKNAQLGGDVNMYNTYDDEIAVTPVWYAKNVATGAAIPITTVAKNATYSGWDVTLDNTIYTALAVGAKIEIGWAVPTVLDTNLVKGVEGIPVVVTK